MEPIIYKPSIYKGAGIYKAGAQGGGDDYKVIGGRRYKTAIIGGVEWLAENLDFKFCNIGGPTTSTPNAWYYDDDESTYGLDGERKCGLLYNWYAVKLLNDNKEIFCNGWHVPTNDEWAALAAAVGGTSTAGTKLKAKDIDWAISWGGTDNFKFGILPAGLHGTSPFSGVGVYAGFWTITDSGSSAYNRYFNTSPEMVDSLSSKDYGISLRLVRDI